MTREDDSGIIWAGQRFHFEQIKIPPTTENMSGYTAAVGTSASALRWVCTMPLCKESDNKNSDDFVIAFKPNFWYWHALRPANDPIRRCSSKNKEMHSPAGSDVGNEGNCSKLCRRKYQKRIGKSYWKLTLTGDIDTLFDDWKNWFIWGGCWLSLAFAQRFIYKLGRDFYV